MDEPTDFQSVTGKGAYATVNNEVIYVGSLKWITSLVALEPQITQEAQRMQALGHLGNRRSDNVKKIGVLVLRIRCAQRVKKF